jgi:hypothetical protein
MSEKNQEKFELVYDPKDVPEGLTDEEQIRFWETHDVTEEFLAKVEEAPEGERPRPRQRTRSIDVLDDSTLERLKELADRRNVDSDTLLNNFVAERLYEEEKREGILAAGQIKESQASAGAAREGQAVKKRDWQSEAYAFVKENQRIIEDNNLDFIVSSRLLKDATGLLLEISNEIKAAGRRDKFPPVRLNRMMKGYNKLEEFVTKAFEAHEAKFGLPESTELESPHENPEQVEQGTREQSRETSQQEDEPAPITSLDQFREAKANLAKASGATAG